MFDTVALLVLSSLGFLAEDQNGGIPWWLILLLLAIVIIVVIWALTRNASFSEKDAPGIEHTRTEHLDLQAAEEPAFIEPTAAAVPAPAVAVVPDDLKIIEGIGPKIAGVLNAAGIQTFAQLAEADPKMISKILEEADPRLARLGDPTTWPAQAKLAAAGDLAGLQALQDTLKGGRQVN